MEETDYKAFALIGFTLLATLMKTLKQSGHLSLQAEHDTYDAVLQQLEEIQAISGDQAAVVQHARGIIEKIFHDLPRSREG